MPPRPCFCPVAHCDACVCVRPVLRPIVCPIWWPILCPILCPFLGRGRLSIRSCVRLCARFCVRFCVRFVSDFVPDFVSDFSGGSKIRFFGGPHRPPEKCPKQCPKSCPARCPTYGPLSAGFFVRFPAAGFLHVFTKRQKTEKIGPKIGRDCGVVRARPPASFPRHSPRRRGALCQATVFGRIPRICSMRVRVRAPPLTYNSFTVCGSG